MITSLISESGSRLLLVLVYLKILLTTIVSMVVLYSVSCIIDFTKAFDNVDYWLLFSKLLDFSKSVACNFAVTLPGFWYNHQCIR